MCALKKRRFDEIKVIIKPGSDDAADPWIHMFKFDFSSEGQGEMIGYCDIGSAKSGDEIALMIGRMVMENSKVLVKWARRIEEKK